MYSLHVIAERSKGLVVGEYMQLKARLTQGEALGVDHKSLHHVLLHHSLLSWSAKRARSHDGRPAGAGHCSPRWLASIELDNKREESHAACGLYLGLAYYFGRGHLGLDLGQGQGRDEKPPGQRSTTLARYRHRAEQTAEDQRLVRMDPPAFNSLSIEILERIPVT